MFWRPDSSGVGIPGAVVAGALVLAKEKEARRGQRRFLVIRSPLMGSRKRGADDGESEKGKVEGRAEAGSRLFALG